MLTKEETGGILVYVAAEHDSWKTAAVEKRQKKLKKLLTKRVRYDIISELPLRTTTKLRNQQTVPWQINSNAALKIPREDEGRKADIKTLEYSERKKNGGGIWKEEATTQKNSSQKILAGKL